MSLTSSPLGDSSATPVQLQCNLAGQASASASACSASACAFDQHLAAYEGRGDRLFRTPETTPPRDGVFARRLTYMGGRRHAHGWNRHMSANPPTSEAGSECVCNQSEVVCGSVAEQGGCSPTPWLALTQATSPRSSSSGPISAREATRIDLYLVEVNGS